MGFLIGWAAGCALQSVGATSWTLHSLLVGQGCWICRLMPLVGLLNWTGLLAWLGNCCWSGGVSGVISDLMVPLYGLYVQVRPETGF